MPDGDLLYPGGLKLFDVAFQTADGASVDPTTPVVVLFDPIDGITTLALTKIDIGEYFLAWTIPADAVPGVYRYKYSGTVQIRGVATEVKDGPYYFQVIPLGTRISGPSQPTSIDATVGGTSANSYVTRADANLYLADQFGTAAWDALADTDKDKALKQATRQIDRYRFHGWRALAGQALNFPRFRPGDQPGLGISVPDSDEPIHSTILYIPIKVQRACCEQALWIAQNASRGGQSARQQLQQEGVDSFRMGDLQETFTHGGKRFGGQSLCPAAEDLLKRWINRTGILTSSEREDVSAYWLPRP